MKYKHLTCEQRYHISALKKAGFNQMNIAKELKVSEATINRELKRNSSTQRKSYSANNAHKVSTSSRAYQAYVYSGWGDDVYRINTSTRDYANPIRCISAN